MSHRVGKPRAAASRSNGARSRGPVTAEGKARASRNALKHGLRAKTTVVLEDEDEAAFARLEEGLMVDLQPSGHLETVLASRLAMAAWRMDRADRIEADLLTPCQGGRLSTLGERITRDRHGAQAIDCLIRYRGTTQAEFWRALAALRAIQNQRADDMERRDRVPSLPPVDVSRSDYLEVGSDADAVRPAPSEPESR
jgi:hypothetical protein